MAISTGERLCVESTIIWLIERLTAVKHLPEKMDPIHSQRKLVKIIAGVVMHELEEMDEQLPKEVSETVGSSTSVELFIRFNLPVN